MKAVLKETKRIMAVLLSVAMIFAYVPSTVFGAENLDTPSENETVEDAQEEQITDSSTGAVEDSSDSDTENALAEEEEKVSDNRDDALNDVTIWFSTPSAMTDISIYDYDTVENLGTKTAFATTDAKKVPADASANGHRSYADHVNGYSFVVEPAAGKSIKGNLINSLKYDNYTSDTQSTEVTIATKTDNWEITDYTNPVVNKGSVKVTITANALKKAFDAGRVVNDSVVGREITVGFESTRTKAAEISVPIVCYDGSVKLVDRMSTDFIASTDADYVMDVKSCVEDFSNYSMGPTSKFLSVQVKDEKGDVITADTKELVGTGILEITNADASNDYHTICDSTNGGAFGQATSTTLLGTKDWVAYVSGANNYKTYGDANTGAVKQYSLYIDKTALGVIYNAGYSVEVVVSGEATNATSNIAVTYSDKDDKRVTYTVYGAGTTAPPATNTVGANLQFNVVQKKATSGKDRKVEKVYYTVKGKEESDVGVSLCETAGTPTGAIVGDVTITGSGVLTDNVSIRTETSEELTKKGDDASNVKVFTTKGELLGTTWSAGGARATDGKKFDFIVVPADGKVVSNVTYQMGTNVSAAPDLKGGVYTTLENVNDAIAIQPTVSPINNGSVGVKLAANKTNITVTALNDANTVINDAQYYSAAEKGKPFYFTVAGASSARVDSVSYQDASGASGNLKSIAYNETSNTWFYMIPTVTGNIDITIGASASTAVHEVYAVENKLVTFDFAKPGKSVKASEGTNFEFTVNPVDSTTTEIYEVGYYYDKSVANDVDATVAKYKNAKTSGDTHKIGDKAGTYSFTVPNDFHSSSAVKNVVVYALTKQKADATTYRMKFIDTASPARIVNTYSEADYEKQTMDTLTAQSLNLISNDVASNLSTTKVYLYNKIKKNFEKGTVLDSTTTGRNPELKLEFKAPSNIATINDAADTVTPTLKESGNAVIVASYMFDEIDEKTSVTNPLNRLVYTKELPVSVKAPYEAFEIVATSDAIYPNAAGSGATLAANDLTELNIRAKNSQTGKFETLAVSGIISNISWEIADIKNLPDDQVNYSFTDAGDSNRSRTATGAAAYVASKKVASTINVTAKITFTTASGLTAVDVPAKTLKCIAKPSTGKMFFVTKLTGGLYDGNYLNTETHSADSRIQLGLATNDAKELNVEYQVYHILDDRTAPDGFPLASFVRGHGTVPKGTTEEDLKTAIERGQIERLTEGVEFGDVTPVLLDDTASTLVAGDDATKYVEVTGSNGKYAVKALKKTYDASTTLDNIVQIQAPKITVNGVAVSNLNPTRGSNYTTRNDDINVRILDAQTRYNVDLILYDSITKKVNGEDVTTITEHKLKNSFIANRPYSEVKSVNAAVHKNGGAYTYDKVTGVKFTSIPNYSSFTLPTAADFETNPADNRVLVGWQICSAINDGVAYTANGSADTLGTSYKAVGTGAQVSGANLIYKAVWADKYGISDLTNGYIVTTGVDDYDWSKKDAKKYDTALGNMVKGGTIPVVLKVSEAVGIDTAGNTKVAADHVIKKSKYVTEGFTLASKYENTASALSFGEDDQKRPTVTATTIATSSKIGVTATWTTEGTTLTKDSADFIINAAPTFKIALDKTSIAVEEGQDPKSAAATINTTLTVPNGAGTDTDLTAATLTGTGGAYNDPANYSFIWSNASAADAAFATAETGYDNDNTQTAKKLTNYVKGISKTTSPVTLTLTAHNIYGQTDSKTVTVTVSASKVNIKLYNLNADSTKSEITGNTFEAQADRISTSTANKNYLLVKAFDETGKDITNGGTWSIETPKTTNKVIHTSQPTTLSTITDGSGYKVADVYTKDAVDTDELIVKYTSGGITYSKPVTVNTYYSIVLTPPGSVSPDSYFITKDGTKLVDKDSKPVVAYVKLGVDKKVKDTVGIGFSFANISLAGYSAVHESTAASAMIKTFDHWHDAVGNTYTTTIESLKHTEFATGVAGTGGIYALTADLRPEIKITGIPGTITLNHDEGATINSVKSYNFEVDPVGYTGTNVLMKSSDVGFFRYDPTGVGAVNTDVTGSDTIGIAASAVGKKPAGKLQLRKGTTGSSLKAGKSTLTFYADTTSSKVLATTTLYVDGLDYDATHDVMSYYESGEKVKNAMRTVAGTVYYFDKDGAQITGSGIYDIEGKKVLIVVGNVAEKGVQTFENNEYFVGDNGVITVGQLVQTTTKDGTVQRYANKDGILVTYAMASGDEQTDTDGRKFKIYDEGGRYRIYSDNNEAKADHTNHKWNFVNYDATNLFNWSAYDFTTKTGNVVATFNCEVGKENGTVIATVTPEEKAVAATETTEAWTAYKYTAVVDKDPSDASISKKTEIKYKKFQGGAWQDSDEKEWKKAGGKGSGEATEEGTTESEPTQPENRTAVNLFYANNFSADKKVLFTLDLPTGADPEKASSVYGNAAKWTQYYDVDSSGAVTLKVSGKDALKKAANASNSLIKIPVFEDSTQVGDFEYSLPVFYTKTSLKLTSTNATFSTLGEKEQEFKTTVTEKKSNGAYEPVDVSAEGAVALGSGWSSSKPTIEVDGAEITIKATGKTNGKFNVQPKSWAEPIALSYSVKQSAKNVITASATTVIMNQAFATGDKVQEAQEVKFFLNGNEDLGDTKLTVTAANWADSGLEDLPAELSGTDNTLTIAWKAAPTKAKNYSVVVKSMDNVKYTLKVNVSKLAVADKTIIFKTQNKMNLTTGQKMILIPQFKGITGEISNVACDDERLEAEYNSDLNQIIVKPADDEKGASLTKDTQLAPTFTMTVAGVDVTTQVKFKPQVSNPMVKIDTVTFPKAAATAGTGTGKANVLSTYKQNGKTFALAPNSVVFKDGTTTLTPTTEGGNEYEVKTSKGAEFKLVYNADEGVIEITEYKEGSGKGASLKVELNYNGGKTVKKTLTIKTK